MKKELSLFLVVTILLTGIFASFVNVYADEVPDIEVGDTYFYLENFTTEAAIYYGEYNLDTHETTVSAVQTDASQWSLSLTSSAGVAPSFNLTFFKDCELVRYDIGDTHAYAGTVEPWIIHNRSEISLNVEVAEDVDVYLHTNKNDPGAKPGGLINAGIESAGDISVNLGKNASLTIGDRLTDEPYMTSPAAFFLVSKGIYAGRNNGGDITVSGQEGSKLTIFDYESGIESEWGSVSISGQISVDILDYGWYERFCCISACGDVFISGASLILHSIESNAIRSLEGNVFITNSALNINSGIRGIEAYNGKRISITDSRLHIVSKSDGLYNGTTELSRSFVNINSSSSGIDTNNQDIRIENSELVIDSNGEDKFGLDCATLVISQDNPNYVDIRSKNSNAVKCTSYSGVAFLTGEYTATDTDLTRGAFKFVDSYYYSSDAEDADAKTFTLGTRSSIYTSIEKGTSAPAVDVDGLSELAAANLEPGRDVIIKMTVDSAEEASFTSGEALAIKALPQAQDKVVEFLNIEIEKYIDNALDSNIHNTPNLIKIVIPVQMNGRKNFCIYRYHDEDGDGTVDPGEAKAFTKLDTNTPTEDGYFVDAAAETITIYTKKFSAYAFGYEIDNGSGNSGGGSYAVSKKCPQDETCVYAHFTDADTKAWYHDGVHYCVEKKYMVGVEEHLFDPEGTLSRGMIVTMLWRIENSPIADYAMTFTDVEANAWYAEAIRWAQSTGVVEGYDAENFGPEDNVTREQLAAILMRYAKHKGKNVSAKTDLAGFTDVEMIADWALESVKWANSKGIIEGRTTTTIAPKGDSTRAEAACMVQRFCKNILKK